MEKYHIKTAILDYPNCTIVKEKYGNNRDALEIICDDGEPLMTATTNLVDLPCEPGHAYIKNYSENEGILDCLVELKVLELQDESKFAENSYGVEFPYVKILI